MRRAPRVHASTCAAPWSRGLCASRHTQLRAQLLQLTKPMGGVRATSHASAAGAATSAARAARRDGAIMIAVERLRGRGRGAMSRLFNIGHAIIPSESMDSEKSDMAAMAMAHKPRPR